jgi:hypothetical protein
MKNYKIYIMLLLISLSFSNCEIDNYEGPDATIKGKIIDHNGNMLQTEQGTSNMRLKMEELSWAGGDTTIAIIPRYLAVKQDGSFTNNKIFAGEYRITPIDGPFYPYSEAEAKIVDIKGAADITFEVTPYLNLEWVTEPFVNENNFIEAEVKFTRNIKEGQTMPDLNDSQLFISTTQYCGNNNYDNQLVAAIKKITNEQEGQTIHFITSRAVKYLKTTYYVRVGINCNDAFKKFNYTDIKTVVVP